MSAGVVVWFTGFSSSGKTTLSLAVARALESQGRRVVILDGDVLRQGLCRDLDFSPAGREENVRRLASIAELLVPNGIVVLVAAISPYRAGRDAARARIGRFLEVHVDAPLEECERRDVNGVYRRMRSGEISGVTGFDDPYEPPLAAEVVCRTHLESVEESARKILAALDALS